MTRGGRLKLVPSIAAEAEELLRRAIDSTGEVRCALRCGSLVARDRCHQLQQEGACSCPTGQLVRLVVRAHRKWAREEEARLEEARKAYHRKPGQPTLRRITCKHCGEAFEVEVGWHRRPEYCPEPKTCREDALRRRQRNAKRLRVARLEAAL